MRSYSDYSFMNSKIKKKKFTCKGCKWEAYHSQGATIDFFDGLTFHNLPCHNCSRHYAQLKDNYTSNE